MRAKTSWDNLYLGTYRLYMGDAKHPEPLLILLGYMDASKFEIKHQKNTWKLFVRMYFSVINGESLIKTSSKPVCGAQTI